MLGRYPERPPIISTEIQPYLPGMEDPSNQPPQGRIPIGLPLLLAANLSYAMILAVRPQWPEDVKNLLESSGIGK